MTANVEDIIKAKAYFELSPEELETVSEYAKTEEEYEDMKWFLLNVGEAAAASKIEASSDLKGRVMNTLAASAQPKSAGTNSATGFLFPKDKQFYRKPAVQMMAAAALILIAIFLIDPFGGMDENPDLAVNEVDQEQKEPSVEEESILRVENRLENETIEDVDEKPIVTEDALLNAEGRSIVEEELDENSPFLESEDSEADDETYYFGSAGHYTEASNEEQGIRFDTEADLRDKSNADGDKTAERNQSSAKSLKNVSTGGMPPKESEKKDLSSASNDRYKKTNGTKGKKKSSTRSYDGVPSQPGKDADVSKKEEVTSTADIGDVKISSNQQEKNLEQQSVDQFDDASEYEGLNKSKEEKRQENVSISSSKELKKLFYTVK